MNICVLTKIPSPYQIELFDALSESAQLELTVVYVRSQDPDRGWKPRPLHHRAIFLDSNCGSAETATSAADLTVFSWYRSAPVRRLIRRRSDASMPWCFWGERPGFRHKGVLGTLYRRLNLWRLWADRRIPIWGIGHWAIEGYRREFGEHPFFHVPYVSDLSPFTRIHRAPGRRPRALLFSGSLTERKGIEDLLRAFRSVCATRRDARLLVMGDGPLRSRLTAESKGNLQISFLGFRDWEQLSAVYAKADILCAPSRYDGWGLIVPEGMAAGMPVVASSSVGSARELIEEGRTGWTFPAGNVSALEHAIERALDQPAERHDEMAALCRERSASYDMAAGVARFIHAAEGTLACWSRDRTRSAESATRNA
jgi:glycosyltransferase involved in cell wall biosynthesis